MNLGDFSTGATVYLPFLTEDAIGTPITLAGTPAVSVYKDGGTTESASGVSLTVDFDSRTGSHLVAIDTSSSGAFYATGHEFRAVLTAGTVNGVSKVGAVLGTFSLGKLATSSSVAAVQSDTDDIQTRLPSALVGGRMDVSVGAVVTGVIGAASFASGALDAVWSTATRTLTAASDSSGVTTLLARLTATRAGYLDNLSAGAVALEASVQGLITTVGASAAGVATAVWSAATRVLTAATNLTTALATPTNITAGTITTVGTVTNPVTAGTVSDKTGYALSGAGVQAVWDALTSALTTAGSIGKWIVDKLDVVLSTRLATSGYTTPPTVGAIADQVWEETLADHSGTSGSTAAALNAAGSAGDPWNTALPGGYGAGTAGKIVGDNLDATVSSRSSHNAADVWSSATRTLTSFGPLVSDIWADVVDSAGVTTLLARLTSARAGYLDNLSAGAVALQASLQALITTIGASAAGVATAVWTAVTRTLTSATNITSTGGTTVPQTGDSYARLGAPAGASVSADVAAVKADTAALPSAATIADTVRDVNNSAPAAGSFGEAARNADAKAANILAVLGTPVGASLAADVADVPTAVRTELGTELGRIDAAVSSRATPAQVNAEVVDALTVDTYAEPASVPVATSSLKDKLSWLFTLGRNKVTQTSAVQTVRNDGDTADVATAAVSDDGTTFERSKWL